MLIIMFDLRVRHFGCKDSVTCRTKAGFVDYLLFFNTIRNVGPKANDFRFWSV